MEQNQVVIRALGRDAPCRMAVIVGYIARFSVQEGFITCTGSEKL